MHEQKYRRHDHYTTSLGQTVDNDTNTMTVNDSGPALMQDVHFIDKLAHFDRERIPERVVHAKGAGAHGYFQPYAEMSCFTRAKFLRDSSVITPVFVRFSTVIGSKGSADTARDPRGFAVKFYTEDGIFDIVGNHLPVFFIRDAIKFPDLIHSLKPSPKDNIIHRERFWDFVSLSPEAMHMITFVYSDEGTIKSYRHINGFGVNTYVWINAQNQRFLVKYHWLTQQGVEYIDQKEATLLAGTDPDVAVRDLYQAIERGDSIQYELNVQIMNEEDAQYLPFDPMDDTKVWPERLFPLLKVGMMTLNANPKNFFAETEQVAMCPANLIDGVMLSNDKMLQGRSFSYADTQRYRLGSNFSQLPINRSMSPVNTLTQDGFMRYHASSSNINYSPNSLNGNRPYVNFNPVSYHYHACGEVERKPIQRIDDFSQPRDRYRTMTEVEKDHLASNIVDELKYANREIQDRVLALFARVDDDYARRVKTYLEQAK